MVMMSAFSKRGPCRREQRALSWASSLFAANLTAGLMLDATMGSAQAQFARVIGFGDSYADTGALPGGAFALAYPTGPVLCIYAPNCTFTGSTTFVQSLQSNFASPVLVNYAIGGARTDNTNTLNGKLPSNGVPGAPGLLQGYTYERAQSASVRYSSSDLIAISIGGNDLSGVDVGNVVSNPAAVSALVASSATASAANAVAGVQQMVGQGARNIAWLSTGSSKWFPEQTLGVNSSQPAPNNTYDFNTTQRDLWADAYYQQTQQILAPLRRRAFASSCSTSGSSSRTSPPIPDFTGLPAPPIARPGRPAPPRPPAST